MQQYPAYYSVFNAMIKIISPDQFKTRPWKNGQGETTELAISPNGTLVNFDWRLSIASVVENGLFSDFSGYDRQLVLLKGHGIKLTHDAEQVDELTTPLSMASFDGASRTEGELIDGLIKDFNVMTKQNTFEAEVKTFPEQQSITCSTTGLNFIYAVNRPIIILFNQEKIELPQGHLFQVLNEADQEFQVSGMGFIVISLWSVD